MSRVKRKVLWLILGLAGAGVLVLFLAILSVDSVARVYAERSIRSETGMETSIGQFDVDFSSSAIRIENLILKNPAEFGGGVFLEIPELKLEVDRDALRNNQLRLKSIRINVREIHLVETKDGRRNIDILQKRSKNPAEGKPRKQESSENIEFAGIDFLDVTLRVARFTSHRDPSQNMETDFAIQNETFHDLRTENDYQTAAAVIAIKAGVSFLLSGGDFSGSKKLFQNTRRNSKEPRDEMSAPTSFPSENATNSNNQ